jgi:hypothetical protein
VSAVSKGRTLVGQNPGALYFHMQYTIVRTLKIDNFQCLYFCEISVKEVSSDAMFDSLISGNGTGEGAFKTAAVVLSSEEDAPPVPQKKQGMFHPC